MPLHSADLETRNLIIQALSVFKFRDYLAGFYDLSAYLVALSFERMILQIGRKFGLEAKLKMGEELGLATVINFLHTRGHVNDEEHKRLKMCRDFRDNIMHKGPSGVTIEETTWVLRRVCELAGIDFEKELERREFEDILSFGERKIKPKPYTRIEDSDFDNFITLYEKCLSLQHELEKVLASLSLVPEKISEFVPTSGGIWLPWVLGQAGYRSHIRRITLGVTFTPSNIRIGLDFGSKAYDAKKQYYMLLIGGKLDSILSRLAHDCSFYETYWYYLMRDVKSIEEYLELAKSSLLKHQIEEAYKQTEVKFLRGQQMTGHKYLIGKIINRTAPEFAQGLLNLKGMVHTTFAELAPVLKMVEQVQGAQKN